jgi:hypothetical protein
VGLNFQPRLRSGVVRDWFGVEKAVLGKYTAVFFPSPANPHTDIVYSKVLVPIVSGTRTFCLRGINAQLHVREVIILGYLKKT